MKLKSVLTLIAASCLAVLPVAGKAATAGDFPSKPIRFVLPFGPGSGTDTSARYYAQKISELAGVPVVVENRPGGNGFIAVKSVLDAPADGYTVFIGSNSTLATNSAVFKDMPYDPAKDFEPITLMLKTPGVLSVPEDSEFKTVRDLVDHAKKNPGILNFGSGSAGYQLMGEFFNQINGIDAANIPFKGAGETITAVASKTVDYGFAEVTSTQTLAQSGRVRALVIADEHRAPPLPDAPTSAEAGIPEFRIYVWTAAVARADTPADIMEKLEGYFHDVSLLPETEEFFAKFGQKPQLGGSKELREFNREDIDLWERIARNANIEKQ
ncbi:tripartite tricarboxylate transporter substrate binding protein [Alcaligenaceae bacterium]|nr:tripartite tricarboxylate transporter substrate binding protein [Alcaligenaceae bacterium]